MMQIPAGLNAQQEAALHLVEMKLEALNREVAFLGSKGYRVDVRLGNDGGIAMVLLTSPSGETSEVVP